MFIPSRRTENALRRQGFRVIAGLDEVGRGAWAGPLIAAAVILDPTHPIRGLRDSKLLSARQREQRYEEICAHATAWAIGIVTVSEIDAHGIGWANLRAFERAAAALTSPCDCALVDGILRPHLAVPVRSFVGGDRRVAAIAAASICAKVTRDRIMAELHDHYPAFGFQTNCGYGTRYHKEALARHGPTKAHRRSFQPCQQREEKLFF